jgi:hypothetical protein
MNPVTQMQVVRIQIRFGFPARAVTVTTYLPQHNARFAVLPGSAVDYHRVRDRRVKDDDIDRKARGRVPAKSTVLVRDTEDGRLGVIQVARDGRERVCAWAPAVARATLRLHPHCALPRRPRRLLHQRRRLVLPLTMHGAHSTASGQHPR